MKLLFSVSIILLFVFSCQTKEKIKIVHLDNVGKVKKIKNYHYSQIIVKTDTSDFLNQTSIESYDENGDLSKKEFFDEKGDLTDIVYYLYNSENVLMRIVFRTGNFNKTIFASKNDMITNRIVEYEIINDTIIVNDIEVNNGNKITNNKYLNILDDNGRRKEEIYFNKFGKKDVICKYYYNNKGFTYSINWYTSGNKLFQKKSIDYKNFDSNGNWIECQQVTDLLYGRVLSETVKREISYYN